MTNFDDSPKLPKPIRSELSTVLDILMDCSPSVSEIFKRKFMFRVFPPRKAEKQGIAGWGVITIPTEERLRKTDNFIRKGGKVKQIGVGVGERNNSN